MTKKKEQPAIDDFEMSQLSGYAKKTQPLFNLGDTFEFDGEQVKVVELLESGNVHLKKIDPPYSSFIVTEGEAKGGKRLTKALDEAIDTFGKERLANAIVEASKD